MEEDPFSSDPIIASTTPPPSSSSSSLSCSIRSSSPPPRFQTEIRGIKREEEEEEEEEERFNPLDLGSQLLNHRPPGRRIDPLPSSPIPLIIGEGGEREKAEQEERRREEGKSNERLMRGRGREGGGGRTVSSGVLGPNHSFMQSVLFPFLFYCGFLDN
jgi:hypothetical protein